MLCRVPGRDAQGILSPALLGSFKNAFTLGLIHEFLEVLDFLGSIGNRLHKQPVEFRSCIMCELHPRLHLNTVNANGVEVGLRVRLVVRGCVILGIVVRNFLD